MLDPTHDPASLDSQLPNENDYSWDILRDHIFGPVETWAPGSLYSIENIRRKADALVEMFEGLAMVQISTNEVHDINVFIDSFEDYLNVLEIGPTRPRSNENVPIRRLRLRRYSQPSIDPRQLAKEFVDTTRLALAELRYQCIAIKEESALAIIALNNTHEIRSKSKNSISDDSLTPDGLRSKMSISLAAGSPLGDHVEALAQIAGRTFNRPTPQRPRGLPSIVEGHVEQVIRRSIDHFSAAS